MLSHKFTRFIKEILSYSPLRKYFFPSYTYNFTPPQLIFLCQCIENTKNIEGAIFEVGCASGHTTVFLNMYMNSQNIEKTYYAIDTFSGFTSEDIRFEVDYREKSKNQFKGFQANNKKWFDETMLQNKIYRVRSIETDVNKYDLTKTGPLSFSLLDVDLYRPMKKALKEIYKVLSPGGIIVVDDCNPSSDHWDGSYQAYKEFMKEIDQSAQIIHGKLGVITKPAFRS